MNNNLTELYEYKDEKSILGDLARELIGIDADYNAGTITLDEKNELVKEVLDIKAANALAGQENALRIIYEAGNLLAAVV